MKNKALKNDFQRDYYYLCHVYIQRDDTKWANVYQRSLSNLYVKIWIVFRGNLVIWIIIQNLLTFYSGLK